MNKVDTTIGVQDTAAVALAVKEAVETAAPANVILLHAGLCMAIDQLEVEYPGLLKLMHAQFAT